MDVYRGLKAMKKEEARLKGKLYPTRIVHFVSANDMVVQRWPNSLLGPVSWVRPKSRKTTTCQRMMKSRRAMKSRRTVKSLRTRRIRRTVKGWRTAKSRRTASSRSAVSVRSAASARRTMKWLTTCELTDAVGVMGDKGMGCLGSMGHGGQEIWPSADWMRWCWKEWQRPFGRLYPTPHQQQAYLSTGEDDKGEGWGLARQTTSSPCSKEPSPASRATCLAAQLLSQPLQHFRH